MGMSTSDFYENYRRVFNLPQPPWVTDPEWVRPDEIALAAHGLVNEAVAARIVRDRRAVAKIAEYWQAEDKSERMVRALANPTPATTLILTAMQQQAADEQARRPAVVADLDSYRARRAASFSVPAWNRERRLAGPEDTAPEDDVIETDGIKIVRRLPSAREEHILIEVTDPQVRSGDLVVIHIADGPSMNVYLVMLTGHQTGQAAGMLIFDYDLTSTFEMTVVDRGLPVSELTNDLIARIPASYRRADAVGREQWKTIVRDLPAGDPVREAVVAAITGGPSVGS